MTSTDKSVTCSGRRTVGFVALAVVLAAVVIAEGSARAGALISEAKATDLKIGVDRRQVRWGELVKVTVTATNGSAQTKPGGIYLSFDGDVLVLDVQNGLLVRAGQSTYDLQSERQTVLKRPMVKAWEKNWKPGEKRRVTASVLPISGDPLRLRVRARVTFAEPGSPPQLGIAPGPLNTRIVDEAHFPAQVEYLWIQRPADTRRALRQMERRLRAFDTDEQLRFAHALVSVLGDEKSLEALLPDDAGTTGQPQVRQWLFKLAPTISVQLAQDPLEALRQLRCVMANLGCRNGLAYFGAPLALYEELGTEDAAKIEARRSIANEKGGDTLLALLDVEGMAYYRDKKTGAVVVAFDKVQVKAEVPGRVVRDLLDQLVDKFGKAAAREHVEVNGMSILRLRDVVAGTPPSAKK